MSPIPVCVFPVSTMGFGVLILGWLWLEIQTGQTHKAKNYNIDIRKHKKKKYLGDLPCPWVTRGWCNIIGVRWGDNVLEPCVPWGGRRASHRHFAASMVKNSEAGQCQRTREFSGSCAVFLYISTFLLGVCLEECSPKWILTAAFLLVSTRCTPLVV